MTNAKNQYSVKTTSVNIDFKRDTFDGKKAKGAALKLARKVPAANTEAEAEASPTEVTIQNIDSGTEFVFTAWAWKEESSRDEEWAPDEVVEASVQAKTLDDPHEWFVSPHEADAWEEDD